MPDDLADITKGLPVAAASPIAETKRELPTQTGPNGIRFDFNAGCQIYIPDDGSTWRVRLSDLPTGNVIYVANLTPSTEPATGRYHRVVSAKRYFIQFGIEIWRDGVLCLTHEYNAKHKPVFVRLSASTVGDSIAWLSYAVKLKDKLGCKLTIGMNENLIPLFKGQYPDIRFCGLNESASENFYASYNVMLFYTDDLCNMQPRDFRLVGLHRTAAYILDVDPAEQAPQMSIPPSQRPFAEPYVCIAAQATTQCKYWNNPNGWRELVTYLKGAGYRVICIDEKPVHGHDIVWNQIPYGAEDRTGRLPLSERAQLLQHADFFIGLSSGLSWLAWAVGIPVVMIAGFTDPLNEFSTPYRVINHQACHGCWHDVRHVFDRTDFLWCPRHKNTPRQFECTKLISVKQVIDVIKNVPGFGMTATVPMLAASI